MNGTSGIGQKQPVAQSLNAWQNFEKTISKLTAIAFIICASAHASGCEQYDRPATALTGTVTVETFFGPPGYGESPATDLKEQQAFLHLVRPLCTVASQDSPAEHDQVTVTLVPLGKFDLEPFAGKLVTVSGSLFPAISGHHHTPVLIGISHVPEVLHSASTP